MRVVPDTNVWITWSARAPEDLSLGDRGDALPFLATITLQELWAGARSTADRAYCERLLVAAQRHGNSAATTPRIGPVCPNTPSSRLARGPASRRTCGAARSTPL